MLDWIPIEVNCTVKVKHTLNQKQFWPIENHLIQYVSTWVWHGNDGVRKIRRLNIVTGHVHGLYMVSVYVE